MKSFWGTLLVLGVLFSSVAQAGSFAWYSAEKYVQKEQDRVAKLELGIETKISDTQKVLAKSESQGQKKQLVSSSDPLSE